MSAVGMMPRLTDYYSLLESRQEPLKAFVIQQP